MEADIPDYDMDSDDEQWIGSQSVKLELTPNKVRVLLFVFRIRISYIQCIIRTRDLRFPMMNA